jgi:protein involved in polysaccharide export with SLBB domain
MRWLLRQRLLEVVDRPQVVALLVEPNARGVVVAGHAATARAGEHETCHQ